MAADTVKLMHLLRVIQYQSCIHCPLRASCSRIDYGLLQIPQTGIFLDALSQKDGMAGSVSLEWQRPPFGESYKARLGPKQRRIHLSSKELSGLGEQQGDLGAQMATQTKESWARARAALAPSRQQGR